MNRSLDELSASELNAAIDDTNFPKVQNAVVYGSLLPSTSTDDAVTIAKNASSEDDQISAMVNASDEPINASHSNGISDGSIMKRIHPAPLKMVSFKDDSFDVPGTPRTPRTSTTPGNETICSNIAANFALFRLSDCAKKKYLRIGKSIKVHKCEIESMSGIANEILLSKSHKKLIKTIRRSTKLSTVVIPIWKLCLSASTRARQQINVVT